MFHRREVDRMPRTNYEHDIRRRRINHLRAKIRGRMTELDVKQRYLADKLGITQPGFSYKLTNMTFTLNELFIIFDVLDFSDRDIIECARGEEQRKCG